MVVSEAVAEGEGAQNQTGDADLCVCDLHINFKFKMIVLVSVVMVKVVVVLALQSKVSQQVQSHTSHPPMMTVGLMTAVSCNIVTQSVCSHAGACWGTCGDGKIKILD